MSVPRSASRLASGKTSRRRILTMQGGESNSRLADGLSRLGNRLMGGLEAGFLLS